MPSPYHFSLTASVLLSLSLELSSHHIHYTRQRFSRLFLFFFFSMDNSPLTPRASSFSIASLITSDGCDDENSLYHSLASPVGTLNHTNINFNNTTPSIEKISNDYYHSHHPAQADAQHFRTATLTETNNGQYQQQQQQQQQPPQVPIKENRSTNHKSHHQVTNLHKSLTTIRNMEGKSLVTERTYLSTTRLCQTTFNRRRKRSSRHPTA